MGDNVSTLPAADVADPDLTIASPEDDGDGGSYLPVRQFFEKGVCAAQITGNRWEAVWIKN